MNAAKNGLARLSVKACENLVDGISKMNLNELQKNPELIDTLKKQLIEENNDLKQKIEQMKSEIKELSDKLPKNFYNENLPLKTPQVLSTNRLAGDALSKSQKDETETVSSVKDAVTKDQKQSKESNKKEAKAKGGNKQATKEPENDKIDSSRLNLLVGKVIEVSLI